MKIFSFPLPAADAPALFAAVARQPYSLFFDSADTGHELGRYSFIAFSPVETIEAKDGRVTVTNLDQRLSFAGNPFRVLKERLALYAALRQTRPGLPPFHGGAAGFFGYDLAHALERLPAAPHDNPDTPDMAVGIYDQVMAFDHRTARGEFIVHAPDDHSAQIRLSHVRKLAAAAAPMPIPEQQALEWRALRHRDGYEAAVARIIEYIRAGDIFQANLSQRFAADLPDDFDPWAHYLTLRRVNPAPFGAYLNFGRLVISSASPERFVSVSGRRAETRPIKGTAPRYDDRVRDEESRRALASSAKDRAENIMIVDLLRNDISKVCEDSSVEVAQLCNSESFARVHHLVSTVTGTLRADCGALDLLEACFPGGSITGAPKVRAMEIIAALEAQARGPYCGAIGYMGYDGTMDTSIAIRTLVYENGKAHFNAGGGITADSEPAAEYDETMAKADGIFRSFAPMSQRKTGT